MEMEPDSLAERLDTPLFTFTVGMNSDETKDITVHSGVIAAQSTGLSELIYGEMQERRAKKARVVVDIGIFQLFCEYAYNGQISEPYYVKVSCRIDRDVRPLADVIDFQKPSQQILRASDSPPPIMGGSLDDYPTLSFYVHLYFFADLWSVTDLKELAISRLNDWIENLNWTTENIDETIDLNPDVIVELLELVYENTPDIRDEPLRDAIGSIISAKIHLFKSNTRFDQMIKGGGDCVKMIVDKLSQRHPYYAATDSLN